MLQSTRTRITALAVVAVVAVLLAAAVALISMQRQVLTDAVDEVLQRYGASIQGQLDAETLPSDLPGQGDEESFALVLDASGQVVASTRQEIDTSRLSSPTGETALVQNLETPDQDYRVMSALYNGYLIRTGTPLDDVNGSVEALTRGLLIAVPVAAALLAAVVWLMVGRTLRPVEALRREVAAISGENLDRRVSSPRVQDEIGRLAETMNGMLERLDRSADKQRRFIADAAHELRTPLTRLRTELDVALVHPETESAATLVRLRHETVALEGLVENLLSLARLEDGSPIRHVPVDLDDLVLREVERARADPRAHIDIGAVSAAQVNGDAQQLSRLIRNVIDNAIVHGGGEIAVTLREGEGEGEGAGEAVLVVADHGPGIPAGEHERMFERFTRSDQARARATGGTGLGLAIAREIVALHGGSIQFEGTPVDGARVVISIPRVGGPI